MTQEDKDLLLTDLSARLPYGVMCNIGLKHPLQLQRIFVDKLDGVLLDFYEDGNNYQVYLSEVKPYLRPMSSMTDEETIELYKAGFCDNEGTPYNIPGYFDYLNSHHFDYRDLILEGLAFPAMKEMY